MFSGLALSQLSSSCSVGIPHYHFCSPNRRSLRVTNCDSVSVVGHFLGRPRHCFERVVEGSNIHMKLLGLLANVKHSAGVVHEQGLAFFLWQPR